MQKKVFVGEMIFKDRKLRPVELVMQALGLDGIRNSHVVIAVRVVKNRAAELQMGEV